MIFVVINRAEKQINSREKRFINEIDIDRLTKNIFGTPGIPFQGIFFWIYCNRKNNRPFSRW